MNVLFYNYSLQFSLTDAMTLPSGKGSQGHERNESKCHLCTNYNIAKELHYLFHCTFFNTSRHLYLPHMRRRNTNVNQFEHTPRGSRV